MLNCGEWWSSFSPAPSIKMKRQLLASSNYMLKGSHGGTVVGTVVTALWFHIGRRKKSILWPNKMTDIQQEWDLILRRWEVGVILARKEWWLRYVKSTPNSPSVSCLLSWPRESNCPWRSFTFSFNELSISHHDIVTLTKTTKYCWEAREICHGRSGSEDRLGVKVMSHVALEKWEVQHCHQHHHHHQSALREIREHSCLRAPNTGLFNWNGEPWCFRQFRFILTIDLWDHYYHSLYINGTRKAQRSLINRFYLQRDLTKKLFKLSYFSKVLTTFTVLC